MTARWDEMLRTGGDDGVEGGVCFRGAGVAPSAEQVVRRSGPGPVNWVKAGGMEYAF
jgi:hypothetical protein